MSPQSYTRAGKFRNTRVSSQNEVRVLCPAAGDARDLHNFFVPIQRRALPGFAVPALEVDMHLFERIDVQIHHVPGRVIAELHILEA